MLKKLAALILTIGLAFSLTAPVAAMTDSDSVGESEETTEVKIDTDKADEPKAKVKTTTQTRLTETKLRVCKKREAQISAIMKRSVARVEKQVSVFNAISERVQAFYDKKGNVSATYDSKLAAVTSAKAVVEADIETLKSLKSFSCDGTNPKGDGSTFKSALNQAAQHLKSYRTSIKNLIVDVKTAQGDSNE